MVHPFFITLPCSAKTSIHSGGAVQNADMILLRVSNTGTIMWQEQWGTTNDDLVQDMIITKDGNIVLVGTVGRSSVYAGNVAAIMKFNAATGAVMWQNYVQDNVITAGGEVLLGVTELVNGDLVAVGGHNWTPSGSDGMICTFNGGTGALINNRYLGITNGDEFEGVVSSGNDVYICGEYDGNSYKDGRVIKYDPIAQVVLWSKYYDFTQVPNLSANYFSDIYLVGDRLMIEGGSAFNYSTSGGSGQFILTIDTFGNAPQLRAMQENATYVGDTKMVPVSTDHVFTIQSPTNSFYDAILWTSTATINTAVTEITSLSSSTANTPVKFQLANGQHSFFDLRLYNALLYMAGTTNDPGGFGNNDIYYVVSNTNLASNNHTCALKTDTITITTPIITYPTPSYTVNTFVANDPYNFTPTPLNYKVNKICGDTITPPCSINGQLSVVQTGTDSAGNCIFTATITASTGSTILGYEWNIPGMPPFIIYTSGSSDVEVFTLPAGTSSATVTVTIHAVSGDFAPGADPCCQAVFSQRIACQQSGNPTKKEATSTGVENVNGQTSSGIVIYPNPTQNEVTITSSTPAGISDVQVIDITGQKIAEYNYQNNASVNVSLQNLAPGSYVVKVNNTTSQIVTKIN